MNPVDTIACQTPSLPRTQAFVDVLEQGGIVVTVRKRKGADIDAACGQLRISAQQPPSSPSATVPLEPALTAAP